MSVTSPSVTTLSSSRLVRRRRLRSSWLRVFCMATVSWLTVESRLLTLLSS